MSETPPLAAPLCFVTFDLPVWPELRAGALDAIDDEMLGRYTVGSFNGWVLRSYLHLARLGLDVRLARDPDPDCVNVVAPRDLGRRRRGLRAFILVPRADSHPPMLANFRLEQNEARPASAVSASMPYWPQAGLTPRDAARGDSLEAIVYKGRLPGLDPAFRTEEFRGRLTSLGVRLEIDAFQGLLGEQNWSDYREADAVLAVRDLTRFNAMGKPASKLVNAWIAGAPALLGPEPAFRALRRNALDYIEIQTPDDAAAAVMRLRERPDLYRAMVENGLRRAADYTVDAIARRWIDVVNGPVAARFERWRRVGQLRRTGFVLRGWALEPLSKAYYRYRIRHGARLLQTAPPTAVDAD